MAAETTSAAWFTRAHFGGECEECGTPFKAEQFSAEAFDYLDRLLCNDCALPILLEAKMDSEWGDD